MAVRRISMQAAAAGTLLAMAASTPVQAGEDYDGRFYISPMLSYVIADDDRHSEDGLGAALAVGARLNRWIEVELRGQYLQFNGDGKIENPLCNLLGTCPDYPDVDLTSGGIGINLMLEPKSGPFLHADYMDGDARTYNAGVGYEFYGRQNSLRLEALYHVDDDADVEEPQFNIAWRIPLGSLPPPPTPEPVRVIEPLPMPTPAPTPPPPSCDSPATAGAGAMAGCGPGDQFVLRGVNFEFDQARLTTNAKALLDPVATELVARPAIDIEIQGHTDSKGTDAYNQKLSERRAQSVVQYLEDKGVAGSRMEAVGYGESRPVADNATDEGRELNRRVELKVVEDNSLAAPLATPVPTIAPLPVSTPAPAAMPAPAAAPGTAAVNIGDMVFEPATLRIPAGTTVTWTNSDVSNHNVTFAGAASGRMKTGATYSRRFDAPGTYDYQCAIHGAMMSGTVIVE